MLPGPPAPRAPLFQEPLYGGRSEGLDLLRGGLTAWVLFTHLSRWGYDTGSVPPEVHSVGMFLRRIFQTPEQTHPAVLAFIVLSGYCIHRGGLRVYKADIQQWVIRRAFRIMPVFIVAALLGAALVAADMRVNPTLTPALTGARHLSWQWTLVQLSGLSALVPAWHTGSLQGNPPLATVMAEIWVYAQYPLVFLAVARGVSSRTLLAGLLVVWGLGLYAVDQVPGPSSLPSWWDGGSALNFLVYWWLGAYFAQPKPFGGRRWVPWALLAVGVVATFAFVDGWTHARWVAAARAVCFSALIGVLLRWLEDKGGLVVRAGAVLGRASYSIYALHAPVMVFLLLRGVTWWAAGLGAVAVGLLCHHAFESPMTRLGSLVARWVSSRRTATMRSLPPSP